MAEDNPPMKYICYLLFFFISFIPARSQDTILKLWPGDPPFQKELVEEKHKKDRIHWITDVSIPDLAVFLPSKANANGQGVIICPGGGYGGLAYDWEGSDIAKWLNSKGIAAFVLKYRLPNYESMDKPDLVPLIDAQRAIRIVRENSHTWNIEKSKIGIMGFSAGGHLASTLGTQYDRELMEVDDLDTISARPDFMILVYPVISMYSHFTHQGSTANLLGSNASEEEKRRYSSELHVNAETPPTMLIHSADDNGVPVDNSIVFYQSLVEAKVPVEMHLYPHGGHGYSLGIGQGHLETWSDRVSDWLKSLNN